MASERNRDEEHGEAFGEDIGISQSCKDKINMIKNNDPRLETFILYSSDAEHFSDLSWELLGRYIADNDHLDSIDLSELGLADAEISLLFKKLTKARSLTALYLSYNEFGLDGIQSTVPFLKNSRSLTHLNIGRNNNINNECFGLLVEALHDGYIEDLYLGDCEIDDIASLERWTLPHLQFLNLNGNNIQSISSLEKYTNLEHLWLEGNSIGREGCRSIANLLQNERSALRILDLTSNDIGDEAAGILADSLKHNTKLVNLGLGRNKFKEKGCRAILKLLNDVSSIERTYNSNHTLTKLNLRHVTNAKVEKMKSHIASAIKINEENRGNSHAAGRAKVIATQLNSITRMELTSLQGVEYSYSSIYADIEPVLIPDLLALTGGKHGQNELYRMLVSTAPDLTSLINRTSMLKITIAKNMSQITALTAENHNLNRRLESIESGRKNQSSVMERRINMNICGKKRRRSASF